jgi:hypothetical protein
MVPSRKSQPGGEAQAGHDDEPTQRLAHQESAVPRIVSVAMPHPSVVPIHPPFLPVHLSIHPSVVAIHPSLVATLHSQSLRFDDQPVCDPRCINCGP